MNRFQASSVWMEQESIAAGNDCSLIEDPAPPPSSHMRLGHGLANTGMAQRNVSCFGWSDPDLTKEQPTKQKLLSESDLFTVLDTPAED